PNHPPQDQEALDLEKLSPRARAAWKKAFVGFLQRLSFKDPRRLVLKSPTHSCRIPTLLELFPRARFVHIVRDPFAVFPSTVNLSKPLYRYPCLQTPHYQGLEEHVFNTFVHLYDRLEAARPLIPQGQLHEVRYEELIADPIGRMGKLYEELNLGGFEAVRPCLEEDLRAHAGYRTNR